MPAWGITNFYNVSAPAGCVQEATLEESVEVATIRNNVGVTSQAQPKNLITGKITMRSKGTAALTALDVGAQTTTIAIISAKYSETNNDYPTSEIEAIYYR